MNKLKTSTKVLISLTAAALILGTVLLITIPQPWVDSIKETHSFMMDGSFNSERFNSFHDIDRGERFHSYGKTPHGFGGVLFIGLILFFIFGRERFHGRKNHSRAILDELYAEEKITLEEYQRKRTVIEEEGK